jgi:site-specific DNA recombinase
MGRLTLNVLLSFAQFEREVTSERIRDKIAASKRKGLWVGGNLPLGYEMKDGKIAVVEEDAELGRMRQTKHPIAQTVRRSQSPGRSRHLKEPARFCYRMAKPEAMPVRSSSSVARAWSTPSPKAAGGSMM